MREIKFRAWWIKNRKWIKEFYVWHDGKGIVTTGPHNNFEILHTGKDVLLTQFTGLKDKSGLKELYEGDIVDEKGQLKGNIYESPQVYKEGIDRVIEKWAQPHGEISTLLRNGGTC